MQNIANYCNIFYTSEKINAILGGKNPVPIIMKNDLLAKTILTLVVLFLAIGAKAQVTSSTANAILVCDGGDLKFDNTNIPNTHDIKLYYSATKVNVPTDDPAAAPGITDVTASITLASPNVLAEAATKTGYYYLKGVPNASNATLCETPYQEIAVYKFKPLSIDFVAKNFCTVSPVQQSGTATTTDATALAYQWYTVTGSTEQAISGATSQNYTPAANLAAGTYTYRLKTAYKVNIAGTDKYFCMASVDKTVVINPKPTAPNVTVTGATPVGL